MKYCFIIEFRKDYPAGLHGGMKAGNLILSIGNRSLEDIYEFEDYKSIIDEFDHEPTLTFELNIAMSKEMFNEIVF